MQRGPDRLGHVAHVALLGRRAVDRPQHGDEREPDEPEPAGVREAGGGDEQERRDAGREVAVRPRRRDLRAEPRERDRQRGDQQQRDDGAGARVAPRQQRQDAAAGREEHGHLGDLPEDPCGHRDERPERGRVRPRRARVCGLVERVRYPGRVEQDHAAVGQQPGVEQPPALGPAGAPQQHEPGDAGRRAEEERPVVGVEHRGEREGEPDRRPPPGGLGVGGESLQPAGRADHPEQRDERVHAPLLRVLREERVAGGQHRRDPCGATAEQRPTGPERDRHAEQGEQHREAVHALLRVAREREPEVQQQVVQRRRAVLAQHARDVAERPVGDPDRQPLVDPESRAELARAQQEGDGEQHADPQRRGDPRAADRPCPQLPRRTGGVGGHGHQSRARGSAVCAIGGAASSPVLMRCGAVSDDRAGIHVIDRMTDRAAERVCSRFPSTMGVS